MVSWFQRQKGCNDAVLLLSGYILNGCFFDSKVHINLTGITVNRQFGIRVSHVSKPRFPLGRGNPISLFGAG